MSRSSRSNNNHYHTIDPSQDQDQAQLQAELQAQLQAELQAQLQGQGQDQDQDQDQKQDQDQGQDQDQKQEQYSSSENLNANGNLNGNVNFNENINVTNVEVDVKVDLELDDYQIPEDNGFADIDMKDVELDNIFMAEEGDISFNPGDDVNFQDILNDAFGDGSNNSAFAINQIADLVDNDQLTDISQNNTGTFDMKWEVEGGHSRAGDGVGIGDTDGKEDSSGWSIDAGDDIAASVASSAAATLNSTAFTQEVVLGANLQQNAVDVTVVGRDNNYTSVGGDDAEG